MRGYNDDLHRTTSEQAEEWARRVVENEKKKKKYLHMSDFGETLSYVVGFLVLCFLLGLLMSLPVMWLWNWLMPMIFGLCRLTWIQAWGVSVLCSLLFKPGTTSKKDD